MDPPYVLRYSSSEYEDGSDDEAVWQCAHQSGDRAAAQLRAQARALASCAPPGPGPHSVAMGFPHAGPVSEAIVVALKADVARLRAARNNAVQQASAAHMEQRRVMRRYNVNRDQRRAARSAYTGNPPQRGGAATSASHGGAAASASVATAVPVPDAAALPVSAVPQPPVPPPQYPPLARRL